jgi:hypothetical protein
MYSGSTLTPLSGRLLGAHQKINRVSRSHLKKILQDDNIFPKSRRILHFEGKKGPDAIKRKSPAKDEPWHFYSPFDENDGALLEVLDHHFDKLVAELKNGNEERSAFEAAWLAHALVDGLTPAHHYPFEKSLEEIWGSKNSSRNTLLKKWLPPADSISELITKSWKAWGPKGLLSTHTLFELGVATIIAPMSMAEALPKQRDILNAQKLGLNELFKRIAKEIAVLDMYHRYQKKGWTAKLVWEVRHKLGPLIVQMVTLAWYLALVESGKVKPIKLSNKK